MFGNHSLRNYKHFGRTYKDAKFVQGGEPCPSIGDFYNLHKRDRGKSLAPNDHYLDKAHLDIVLGNTIRNLVYHYAILITDLATKYIWFYGMKSLVYECIIKALEKFRADDGSLPKKFRCDCDQKLLGGNARRWIYRVKYKIIGAPTGR